MSRPDATSDSPARRLRIRFRKEGTLRWISHRDLMRMFERLVRRAGLRPCLSRGYHPKPKMHFASALALGAEGWDEVVEIELVAAPAVQEIRQRLDAQSPAGLTVTRVDVVPPGMRKAQVAATRYAIELPPDQHGAVDQAIERLRNRTTLQVQRHDEPAPQEVPVHLEQLRRDGGTLQFTIPARGGRAARPRELLAALGLQELLRRGYCLTRTAVELTP